MRATLVRISQKIGLYKTMVKIDTCMREKKLSHAFKKHGLETLIIGSKAFESMNAKMIPIFGTLLGAYRDHGFIPFDNDLDVAVKYSERPNDIAERMKTWGFTRTRQFYIKTDGRVVEEQFTHKGVQMDVFYLFEEDDINYTAFSARRHEYKEWREANDSDGFPCVAEVHPKCEFTKKDFMGHQLYIPDRAADWLRKMYGENFMTPDKNWSGEEKPRREGLRVYRRND